MLYTKNFHILGADSTVAAPAGTSLGWLRR